MRLILASQSPRRRELLTATGWEFETLVPDESAESGMCSGESARQMVQRFAKQKAENVAQKLPQAGVGSDEVLIIACDTVAECQGQILGKPQDYDHADQMLRMLRGREHVVHSGLCLFSPTAGQMDVSVDTTQLWMEPITDAQLTEYLDSDLWIGKAGGFGYQDRTGWLSIKSGSESNVVGLPMELLQQRIAVVSNGALVPKNSR